MIKFTILLCVAFLAGCGSPYLVTVPSLSAQQPRVVSVLPRDKATAKASSEVLVILSRDIDKETVGRYSFLVVENYVEMPTDVIKDEIEDAKITGIEGAYHLSEDATCITFVPQNGLKPQAAYGVILTTDITTRERLPLPKMFVSQFTVADDGEADGGINEGSPVVETEASPAEGGTSCDELEQNTSENQEDANETESDTSNQEEGETIPATVVLNEVYYDAADSDTDGNLFIELKGTPKGDIAGYKLVMVNGDDGKITGAVTLPAGARISEDGLYVVADAKTGDSKATNVANYDFIANFDPQNGPDAVQLLDAKGSLVDAVCYGEPKADTAENKLALCEGSAAPDASAGASISRQPGAEDTNDNAVDFVVNTSPSAGSEDITKGE